ncbi:hypothetical protein BKA70DRAFT_1472509 [Coprinopsis sp. MPI-PUGE-AT-0042]|nr:hypothetical protein BKA70DRAFT_1472509 [Coprinopsis sp. MPI-PUGE-AT-0042]
MSQILRVAFVRVWAFPVWYRSRGGAGRGGIKGSTGTPERASPKATLNSPTRSDTTPFHAYIHYPTDDNVWRMTMIFANRATADEWWRAVSESTEVTNDIRRITPQYYTHDAAKFNVFNFFVDGRIKTMSDPFRGRLFLQLENDRGGRGLASSALRPFATTSMGTGGFYIRSKVEPHIYWYDAASNGDVVGSYTRRTRFRVTINTSRSGVAPKAGAIIIGSDLVTIQSKQCCAGHRPVGDLVTDRHNTESKANQYVGVSSGNSGLVQTNTLNTFGFGDLLEGKSVNAVSTSSDGAALFFFAGPDSNPGEFWELA